jgi:hypothetical protein
MLPDSYKTRFVTSLKTKAEGEGVRIVCGKLGLEQVYDTLYFIE